MYILIALLLLILAIFGIAGVMDSYATAKQAQATIEVAQVAQVNAWGNLIVILLLALVILCVAGVIVWMVVKRSAFSGQRRAVYHRIQRSEDEDDLPALTDGHSARRGVSIETLVQLKTLELLDRMSRPTPVSALTPSPSPEGRGEQEDELGWLR